MSGNDNKPRPIDFSKTAISKHVFKAASSHPSVVYLAAAGLLGGASLAVFGPTVVAATAAVVGLTGAATSWLVNYKLRDEHFARAYVASMTARLERQRKESTQGIGRQLDQLGMREAHSQFLRASDKYALYKQTLDDNLHDSELTYARYLGTGEQVFLSMLDNLKALIHARQGADRIDEAYILGRIRDLRAQSSPHAQTEIAALNQRLELKKEHVNKVEEILSRNEVAMTQLDMAIQAVAGLGNANQQTTVDLETAVAELARLAKRTKHYS